MTIAERLNSEEARRALGCTVRKLKELRRNRQLKFYRLGHRTVTYDRLSLEQYLKSCEVPAIGDAA